MKVNVWVRLDHETEADVELEDVVAMIEEAANDKQNGGRVVAVLNRIAQVLKAMNQNQIDKLNGGPRKVIASFLREQASRFDVPQGGEHGGH